jgi:hypothetical protein
MRSKLDGLIADIMNDVQAADPQLDADTNRRMAHSGAWHPPAVAVARLLHHVTTRGIISASIARDQG